MDILSKTWKKVPFFGLELMFILLVFWLDFPRVLSMPLRLYLPKGMLGKIECPTEANPPRTMTLWHKNDVQIDFTQTTRMKVSFLFHFTVQPF